MTEMVSFSSITRNVVTALVACCAASEFATATFASDLCDRNKPFEPTPTIILNKSEYYRNDLVAGVTLLPEVSVTLHCTKDSKFAPYVTGCTATTKATPAVTSTATLLHPVTQNGASKDSEPSFDLLASSWGRAKQTLECVITCYNTHRPDLSCNEKR